MRSYRKWLVLILMPVLLSTVTGCAITLEPKVAELKKSAAPPILRLGDLTHVATGTWTSDPGNPGNIWRNSMSAALQRPETATIFSDSSSNLVLNIQLTIDHQSDIPRLNSLGALSLITLGIIPLKYFSEWDLQTKAVVLTSDKQRTVAEYSLHDKGSYKIWAYPLTMFSLFGAGARGDSDGREIAKRTCEASAAKLMAAIDQDYAKLRASYVGSQGGATAAAAAEKPLLV